MNSFLSSGAKGAVAACIAVVLGCGPSDGVKELEQGKEAYGMRDLKKAEKLFSESVACAPQDVGRILMLARVKFELGLLDEARDLVTRAQLTEKGAVDIEMLSAQIAWHEKDYEAAAAGFSALANDVKQPPDVRSQAWAGIGVVEMAKENRDLARIAFLRAIRLNRKDAAAWYHLGILYQEKFGYLESALEQFEIFVRLEQDASPRVQTVQRTVIPALKDQIAAKASQRPGVSKRNTAAGAAAQAKAEAAIKKGLFKAARQSYQEALEADPLSYSAALGLAKAWEKTDTTRVGMNRALDNYQIACLLHPSAVATFMSAGALAVRLGLVARAVEFYSRAVAANPASVEALDGLVLALRKTNQTNIAQAYQAYRASLAVKSK